MQWRLGCRPAAALKRGKPRAAEISSRGKRRTRAQHHVGSVRERGLVGGREEWEEFAARSCVRGGTQGEGGQDRGDAATR